jgi:hypothetical protein
MQGLSKGQCRFKANKGRIRVEEVRVRVGDTDRDRK